MLLKPSCGFVRTHARVSDHFNHLSDFFETLYEQRHGAYPDHVLFNSP